MLDLSAFQATIFDFDGTLADSMWVWDDVDHKFFERRNIPYSEEFAEMIAVLGFERGADYVVDYFGLNEAPEDIIEEWKSDAQEGYAAHVKLKDGASELLHALHAQGKPLAIATSLQRHLLEPCLRNNGVFDLFSTLVICDELQCKGKSTPEPYLEAAKRLEADITRCVIFEDVVAAAQSAKKSGAFVVGVYDPHKQQATEELKSVCDAFINSFDDVRI